MSFIITNILGTDIPEAGDSNGFRPPQWSTQGQLVSLTVQLPTDSPFAASGPTTYYFDAVFRTDHLSSLTPTRHPVQNGAAITDHTYLEPKRVVLEVGFSDAMDSYVSGQYAGASTKS